MPNLALVGLATSLLDPIDLLIGARETVVLHGKSGSGKSLLLRAIADLDEHAGDVQLGDTVCSAIAAPEWRRRVGLLAAETTWWDAYVGDHFHAADSELVSRLGLPREIFDWEVNSLSTGERQRLGIARLLDNHPQALLLDEPTANLDPEHKRMAETLLQDYQADNDCPVLWVSHDAEQRRRVGDRIFRIEQRRLVEETA